MTKLADDTDIMRMDPVRKRAKIWDDLVCGHVELPE